MHEEDEKGRREVSGAEKVSQRIWTKAEEQRLIEYYQLNKKYRLKNVAAMMGRSLTSIRAKLVEFKKSGRI